MAVDQEILHGSFLPLDGYRVIDFGWVWSGPLVGGILADMGAEVIKVESRQRLDTSRWTADNIARDPEKDFLFHSLNRNKLGITIDLSKAKAIPIIKGLAKISDIIIENFAPGVMKKLGLNYKSLREINPRVIVLSLPGAGQSGPLSDIPTYAPSVSSLAGLAGMIGYYGDRVIGQERGIGDPNSSMHGAFAVLAALYYREQSGEGQYIELSQLEALVGCLAEGVLEYTMNGRIAGTQGNRHPSMAPHNCYRCKGEDKWVSIAVGNEEEWHSLCQAMGNPPWTADEKFADMYRRLRNQEELDKLIATWTINYSAYEVTEILQRFRVAAAPCLGAGERFANSHFNKRETYLTIDHPAVETEWVAGIPWKMAETPGKVYRPAPLLGQHNDYVFKDLLGMSDQEIDELTDEDVIN